MGRVKLHIHFSFYVALAIYLLLGQFLLFVCYVVAMLLHEMAHYLVANRLFYKCAQMELSCFGVVLYGDFSYASNKDTVAIAFAGPVANLVVALTCVALWWIFPSSYYYTADFVGANLGMAFVNLLPIYPLDGGKITCSLLQKRLSKQTSLSLVKKFGFLLAVLLFVVFVLALVFKVFLPSLCLFSIFVFCSSFAKGKTLYARRSYLESYTKRMVNGVEKKTLVFDINATVSSVAKRMIGGSLYQVELWHNGKLVKSFTFYQLDAILKNCNPNDKLICINYQQ